MGHNLHFLFRTSERCQLSPQVVERAMVLYRDPQLLSYLCEHAREPAGFDSVAIALSAGQQPAHLIVRRNGEFVTLLEEGMVVRRAAVLSYSRFESLTEKMEDLRARLRMAERLTGSPNSAVTLLNRLATVGRELSQEEFIGASAWTPLIERQIFYWYQITGDSLSRQFQSLRRIRRVDDRNLPALRTYWQNFWLLHHLGLLFSVQGREFAEHPDTPPERRFDRLLFWLHLQGTVGALIRAAWMAAKLGKPMLAPLKGELASPTTSPRFKFHAACGLMAIAVRHRGLRGEISKAFAREQSLAASQDPSVAQTLAFFLHALDHPAEIHDNWMQRATEEFSRRTTTGPRAVASETVSDRLACAAVAASSRSILHPEAATLGLLSIPTVAQVEAEDFYFPAETLTQLKPSWQPADVLQLLEDQAPLIPKNRPHIAKPVPGRNDPCICGSGKKYKMCCGG